VVVSGPADRYLTAGQPAGEGTLSRWPLSFIACGVVQAWQRRRAWSHTLLVPAAACPGQDVRRGSLPLPSALPEIGSGVRQGLPSK